MTAKVIAICVLLFISAFFSASEMAYSTVNKIRLKAQSAQGGDPYKQRQAKRALHIAEHFDKALTTILVGNNVVNTASAALGTLIFTELFGASGVGMATAAMTVAVLIFGEILPKSVAKENADSVSIAFSGILTWLIWVLTPVTWLFSQLKKLVSLLMHSSDTSPSVTEDELKYIIDESEEQGVLEEQESDLVKSALEFDDIEVSKILVPRVNVVAVEESMTIEEIRDIFLEEQYTRLPVYERTIDSIIGVLHQKDFFKLLVEGKEVSISSIITPPMYISDRRQVSEVLRDMQRSKTHMAIVMDQYGGTQGIVTMEDVIEELVGEIYDENDEVVTRFERLDNYTAIVEGSFPVTDFLEEMELPEGLIETERNSIGGWAMELFGRIPEAGDVFAHSPFTLTILAMEEQKISRVKLVLDENAFEEPEEEKTKDKDKDSKDKDSEEEKQS